MNRKGKTTKPTDDTAYREGREAHQKGLPITDNPHRGPFGKHLAWRIGWISDQAHIGEKAMDLYRAVESTLAHLQQRWLDEKEYEDIRDYQAPIQKFLDRAGATNVKMNSSPFGFNCTIEGERYRYAMTQRGYSCKNMKRR